jgi:DNA primase
VIGSDLATLVKQAVDIVEVVGQIVPLRRSGSRHVGLCPFHHEKTPSFYVDSNRQMYHCFGCGSGGDVLSFVMKHQNLAFVDAIQYLADRYHLNLPQKDPLHPEAARLAEASKAEQEQVYKVMALATDFFARQLKLPEVGRAARDYVLKRALSPELVETERLGYALPQWDGLLKHLQSSRIDPDLGVKAGLLARSGRDQGRLYDRFRNRLIFPIRDERSRVVAFGGRILAREAEDEPKYLNSPENPVFHKGRMLYQFAKAQEACRRVHQVVLVEGYMDLLAFHAQAFYRVVATLGTALTPHQVRLLARHFDEVVLAYDGDEAGERAMLRALPLFLEEELAVSCIRFPEQMDPDDFLRTRGLAAFEHLVQRREELGAYAIRNTLENWDGSIAGKTKVLAELQPIYRKTHQPVLKAEYLRLIADRLALSETAIQRQLQHEARHHLGGGPTTSRPPAPLALDQAHSLEENILRMMIQHPEMIEEVKESGAIDCFQETGLRSIAEVVTQIASPPEGDFSPSAVHEQLPDSELKDCFTRLLLDPYELNDARLHLQDWLNALRKRDHKKRRLDLREALRQAEQSGDQVQIRKLVVEIQGIHASQKRATHTRDTV